MEDLVRLEKERNLRPNPEVDAFMKVHLNFYTSVQLFMSTSDLI